MNRREAGKYRFGLMASLWLAFIFAAAFRNRALLPRMAIFFIYSASCIWHRSTAWLGAIRMAYADSLSAAVPASNLTL